jgi:hypothetical protein
MFTIIFLSVYTLFNVLNTVIETIMFKFVQNHKWEELFAGMFSY